MLCLAPMVLEVAEVAHWQPAKTQLQSPLRQAPPLWNQPWCKERRQNKLLASNPPLFVSRLPAVVEQPVEAVAEVLLQMLPRLGLGGLQPANCLLL